MTTPKNRSNSVRKIKYRSPSGESRIRYRRRPKGKTHHCALTKAKLTGVHSTRGMKPSLRRPNRPFGGRLAPGISKRVIIYRTRLASGAITLEDIPVSILPYVKNIKKN